MTDRIRVRAKDIVNLFRTNSLKDIHQTAGCHLWLGFGSRRKIGTDI